MSGEDLYAEQACPHCGKSFLKAATFCPHCGYVKEESWWERVTGAFRSASSGAPELTSASSSTPTSSSTASPTSSPASSKVFATLIGLVIAGVFLYQALQSGSIQSWILAAFSLIMAVRAWFTTRTKHEDTSVARTTTLEDIEPQQDSADKPDSQHFFCENCGTEVPADASTCPKCGMKFG